MIGIDNFSKYGDLKTNFMSHKNFEYHVGDVKDTDALIKIMTDCDQVVASAAKIGGISYFHEYAYLIFI